MMDFIEKNISLRIFNYLRIRHGYSLRYNLVIPLATTAAVTGSLYYFKGDVRIVTSDGLVAGFSQILAILAPFYIASLAAVSTFVGQNGFDREFQMKDPLEIRHLYKGQWVTRALTLRQFLSLLFGYCSAMSMVLFLFSLITPFLVGELPVLSAAGQFWSWIALIGFLFAFFHMLVATLLGMYYLSDKMHRPED